MNKLSLVCLLLLGGVLSVNADETNQPIDVASIRVSDEDGAKLTNAFDKKLFAIKIPSVNFNQATLTEVVSSLKDASTKYDKSHDGMPVGVSLGRNVNGTQPPYVTLNAQNISVLEVLKYLSASGDFRYSIQGGAILILRVKNASTSTSGVYAVPINR